MMSFYTKIKEIISFFRNKFDNRNSFVKRMEYFYLYFCQNYSQKELKSALNTKH